MRKKQPADFAMDLLRLVVGRISYFEQEPSHLAWVMMHYATLIHRSRVIFDDWTNPKDAILDLKGITQEQENLIYDAWGVTVSNDPEFNDAALPLERKPYKTMNEWIDLLLDPRYRYSSIHPSRQAVCDYLLCTIGTGMKWVEKDGVSHIANVGPCGTNKALFAGYTKAGNAVDPGIRSAVLKIANRFGCLHCIKEHIENGRKAAKGWKWEMRKGGCDLVPPQRTRLAPSLKQIGTKPGPKRKKSIRREYCPMSQKHSNLLTMPGNAHPSYLHAGLRIACEILLSPTAHDRNVKLAWGFYRKSPYARWHPKTLLGHLTATPGPLPTAGDLGKPVYKTEDWVVESQNPQPEIGIVKRITKRDSTGRIMKPWLWKVDVDVYSCAGIRLKTIRQSQPGRWLKIRAPKFPIRPDKLGHWHGAVTVVYYPHRAPKNTVERWRSIGASKKKAKA